MVMLSWLPWNRWLGVRRGGHRGACVHAVGVEQRQPAVDGELPAPEERPWGCGWFDSSLDLRQGLAVIEHEGLDLVLAVEALFQPVPVRQ